MLCFHPYFDIRHNWDCRDVSCTPRPHFTPKKIPWYWFPLEADRNPGLLNGDRGNRSLIILDTIHTNTDMRRLTTGIRSEKCVVRRFSLCANIYSNKPTYYSLPHTYAVCYSLLLLGYKPVLHVTVLNTVSNCNTMISIIIYCILYMYRVGGK